MTTIYERNFKALTTLVPGICELQEGTAVRLKSSGFMDLTVDCIERPAAGYVIVAMAHRYEQNGDLVPDPEMVLRLHVPMGTVEALSIEHLGRRWEVYSMDGKRYSPTQKSDQNRFLAQWLVNLKAQGHQLTNEPRTAEPVS